jgi:hypothetical protein
MSQQIRFLVESYYDVQHLRIEAFNKIVAWVGQNPNLFKSHMTYEPQGVNANQNVSEPQYRNVNHRMGETQLSDVNQANFETQTLDVNQEIYEPHIMNVNHMSDEPPIVNQEEIETQSDIADKIVALKIEVPKDIAEMVWYHNSLLDTEKNIAKKLDGWSKTYAIRTNYLNDIKGIGPIFSSAIIAWISPIDRFANISKLWSYAGLSSIHYECACKDGHKMLVTHPITLCPVRIGEQHTCCNTIVIKCVLINSPPKRKAGYVIFYNQRLKTLLWKIATSFEKQNAEKSSYRRLYLEKKDYYTNRPDLKGATDKGIKGHIRNMTLRYVAKRFLSDLWTTWRKMENLPVTEPYQFAMLEHTGKESITTDKR